MAHFTGLKELQNHPHKAGFDIGSKNLFTAKIGELLPLYWDVAIPDCDYDIDLAYFTGRLLILVFVSTLIFMPFLVISFGNHLILL